MRRNVQPQNVYAPKRHVGSAHTSKQYPVATLEINALSVGRRQARNAAFNHTRPNQESLRCIWQARPCALKNRGVRHVSSAAVSAHRCCMHPNNPVTRLAHMMRVSCHCSNTLRNSERMRLARMRSVSSRTCTYVLGARLGHVRTPGASKAAPHQDRSSMFPKPSARNSHTATVCPRLLLANACLISGAGVGSSAATHAQNNESHRTRVDHMCLTRYLHTSYTSTA